MTEALKSTKNYRFCDLIFEDISEWPLARTPLSVVRQDQWLVAAAFCFRFAAFDNVLPASDGLD